MQIDFQQQRLHLHPFRAIYWEDTDTLFMADLHLGKAAHFRKNGLAAPAIILQKNLEQLRILLDTFAPQRVLFLGDLFHSTINNVWMAFTAFMDDYREVQFDLIQGNHDILDADYYAAARLVVHTEPLVVSPFIFSHYPLKAVPRLYYNFYGHIHPGVQLRGKGGQSLRLPCFHLGQRKGVLPAFGAFTGLAMIQATKGDELYVIAGDKVLAVEV
ncbi:MAG: ligase-associated DNA damage response endonuclease PdeM [Bacteroidota bacterium]